MLESCTEVAQPADALLCSTSCDSLPGNETELLDAASAGFLKGNSLCLPVTREEISTQCFLPLACSLTAVMPLQLTSNVELQAEQDALCFVACHWP